LLKIHTTFGPGLVLKIETKDGDNFQFGMQLNTEWTNQNAIPLKIEKGNLKSSIFSIAIRLFIIGYVIYWIINNYF